MATGSEHEMSQNQAHGLFPSARLGAFLLAVFMGMSLSGGYGAFNFALVCMVNETAIPHESPKVEQSNETSQCRRLEESFESEAGGYDGEFAWDKAVQANLLAANAFGSLAGSIGSALVSDRYGAKMIFLICSVISAIAMALTPTAAYAGIPWLFVARLVQGSGIAATWGPMLTMVSTWGTASDSATLLTLGATGFQMGPLLAMATSSSMCSSPVRWPLIFYVWSSVTVLAIIVWFFLYTDDPTKCPCISRVELEYIQSNSKRSKGQAPPNFRQIPWKMLLTKPCAVSVYFAHFCSCWAIFYITMFMPTYCKEVLHLDVGKNGLTSALPLLCLCAVRLSSGPLSDKITFCGRSKTFSVKIFTLACMMTPCIFFIILGFLDCDRTALAIGCFCMASGFIGTSTSSYIRGGVTMAPRYAGAIGALANIGGYSSAIAMPYVVGTMTKHGTVQEWQHTTFVTAAVLTIGYIVYQIFGSAQEQKWAVEENKPKNNKIHVITGTRDPFNI